METPLPTTQNPQSLNVEESRAKRLERQQSRLRDRGGIFRPENRNNNLFDILCKATRRQSPAKARGRSRSRSVSPKKKITTLNASGKLITSKANARRSPRKSMAAPDTERPPEKDICPKPQDRRSKGKRKQAAAMGDTNVNKPKPKPRAKKAAPRKSTTKALRRTTKTTTDDDGPPNEGVDPATKPRGSRSKGKRKKQDTEDDEFAEGSPAKSKKIKTTKDETAIQPPSPILPELKASNSPKHKNSASKTKRQALESDDENSRLGAGEGSGKPKSIAMEGADGSSGDPLARPTRAKATKRKAEVAGTEDETRPQKRQARPRSGSDSKAERDSQQKSKLVGPSGTSSTSQSIADAINRATALRKRPAEEDLEVIGAKHTSKKAKPVNSSIPSRPNGTGGDHESKAAKNTKKKGSHSQAGARGEQHSIEMHVERLKTRSRNPPKDVLQPKGIPIAPEDDTDPSKSSLARKSEQAEVKEPQKPPALKTVSRKRKENAAAARPASSVSAKRKPPAKKGPGIPAHVKRKIQARQDIYASDGEPDPIDFLS